MRLPATAASDPVGHGAERARIRDFVAGPWPAEPLLLTGEPGSGRTALLAEAVRQATALGCRVLTARAAEHESELAFGGLFDLLDGVLDEVIDQLPELPREAVEVAFLRRRATGEPSQLAVGAGVAAALHALAAQRPLLLAVDDVQWMDRPSVLALDYSLRRATGPVTLLATARELPAALAQTPAPPFTGIAERLPLPGLAVADFPELLRRNGIELSVEAAAALHAATGGNPGWALEARAPGEPLPLPAALAGPVRDRLATLGPATRTVLHVVAASGTAAPDRVRAALAGELDQPGVAIDDASAEGVIAERGGRIDVAHPLLAAAALAELAPCRRRELHSRLAAIVDDAEARAYHLQQSAQPGPDRATADALMAAARQARRRGAAGSAARMAEQALARAPEGRDDGHQTRVVDAAAIQFTVGAFRRVVELLSTVDVAALPMPLLDRGLSLLVEATALTSGTRAAAGLVEELRARFAGDELRLAMLLGVGADPDFYPADQARAMAGTAVERLRTAVVGALARHRALSILLELAEWTGGEPDETLVAEQQSVYAELVAAGAANETTVVRAGYSLWIREDPVGTADRIRRHREIAAARGERYAVALYTAQLAANELARGDYPAAGAVLAGLDRSAFGDSEPPVVFAVDGYLRIAAGDYPGFRALHAAQDPTHPGDPGYRELYALVLTGMLANRELRWAAATEAFTAAAGMLPQLGRLQPAGRLLVDAELVEALLGAGSLDKARPIAQRLYDAGESTGRVSLRGTGMRLRGMCAAAAGDLDIAEHQLCAAAELLQPAPMRLELARVLLELGKVRRRRRGRRSAREYLSHAAWLFTDIGDVSLARQAEAELARLAPAREKRELTTAERRVAELVVTGASNREVAAALFVSVRTVESHVQSVYRKLGVHSRTQLAARLLPGTAAS